MNYTQENLTNLQDIRQLLTPEAQWIKGSFARTPINNDASPDDPTATCWCLDGAITRITGEDDSVERDIVYTYLKNHNGVKFSSPILFNDAPSTTHKDILALLDAIIKEVEYELSSTYEYNPALLQ